MQTFLPYADFAKSAATLDYRRLGKQRVEAWQILNTLLNGSKTGWANHPAVLMWKGYEFALIEYGIAICLEWIYNRNYRDTLLAKFQNTLYDIIDECGPMILPPWVGDPAFHASHRSNLLRKDPVYYSKFKWTEPDNLEYVWPVQRIKELA